MFVTQTIYNKLARELNSAILHLETYKKAHARVTGNWNELVERINAKGGEDFLEHGVLNPPSQFSKEEVDRLVRLCHPDKHNGSIVANEITKKLLKLKKDMK